MSWLTEPDSDWDSPDADSDWDEPEPRSRLKLVALLVAGWLAVSALVLVLLLAFRGHSGGGTSAASSPGPSAPASSAASTPAATPAGWVRRGGDQQTDCAHHSYGKVQAFFAGTPCRLVQRMLASTEVNGRPVVIASNVVTFASADQAQRYLGLVNTDGTGNISDLLREGLRYPGGPSALPDAAFASRRDGARVLVAEAAYASGAATGTDAALHAVAEQALQAG